MCLFDWLCTQVGQMCRMNESVAEPHVEDVMGSVLPRMQFESHAQKKKKKKLLSIAAFKCN